MNDPQDKIKDVQAQQEERLAQEIAALNELPYIHLSQAHKPLPLITRLEAQTAEAVVTELKNKTIAVVVRNPKHDTTQKLLQALRNKYNKVNVSVVSDLALKLLIKKYPKEVLKETGISEEIEITDTAIKNFDKEKISIHELEEKIKKISSSDASMALEILFQASIGFGATDIHIEPQSENTVVRIKLDGILYEITKIDQHLHGLLLSRIKLLSGLKLNIHNESQEGNFSVNLPNREVEIRTSILPSQYGEDIALRILDPNSIVSLEELGLRKDLLSILKKHLSYPQGLILATGPTGSGKTTTLYACLNVLKAESTKIITIEDPIEYKLEGITQTEVNKDDDYTFSSGLRAILRQDPDALMLSELRDLDSTDPALQAALAGKKVFSTLHTIDAAGTSARLIDMGADPATVSSALSAAISQRLVRKLCKKCKKSTNLTDLEYQNFTEILGDLKNVIEFNVPKGAIIYEADNKGCTECSGTGYAGRTGVFEIMSATEGIKKQILENPSEEEMRDFLKQEDFTTMMQDAIVKVLQGITSISEIKRVLG